MKLFLTAAFYFLLTITIPTYAQIPISLTTNKQRLLDSITIQDVPNGAPGIASAIVQNGAVIYKKYKGFANLADSVTIGENTRFNIASNGKQFTALAILILADEKKLNLADDIRKYFPKLLPMIASKITISQLLNHTSGIRDFYDLLALQGITWWKEPDQNNDVLQLIEKQQSLNFEPGSKHLYSNTNYVLLALIIEKVASESFVSFTNRMFKQLNMPNTSFEDNAKHIKGPIAKSYFNFNTWTTYEWIWNVCGDGNLFSTLADQIEWETIVQGKRCGVKREIITQSQQVIPNSIKKYGYGLEFDTYKGLKYAFHEGATGAWKATVLRFPNQKTSFITLTNTGKSIPSMQTRQLVDVLFDLKPDKAYLVTKPAKIGATVNEDELLGTYLTENDFTFNFERKEGKLFLKRIGRNDVELERESANIYHQKYDPDFKQEFLKNEKGELTVTAYYTSHAPYTLKKLANNWNGFNFKSIDGTYANAEINTAIKITNISEDNYEVTFHGDDQSQGLLISRTKMLVNGYILDFSKDKFFLKGSRISKVKFERK